MRRSSVRTARRVTSYALLALGSLLVAKALAPSVRAAMLQQDLSAALAAGREVDVRGVELTPGIRLKIESIALDTVAVEATEELSADAVLALAPLVQRPSPGGPLLISAHRDGEFSALGGLGEGDPVSLLGAGGTMRVMHVVALEIVRPEETHWLEREGEASVVLSTCYPFDSLGPAPLRFVVLLREGRAQDSVSA